MTASIPAAVDRDVTMTRVADPHDLAMIAAYLEHLRRAGRSADTISLRRTTLNQLNAHLVFGLGGAADEELAEWIYNERIQANSRATYLTGVRSFYRWAVKARWITVDPTVDLESIKTTRGIARPCTDEQLHAILTRTPKRIQTWAVIAAYQGLRCCEISGLDREHITEQRLIVVRGKGGAARAHDTHPDVWAAVRDLPPGPIARLVVDNERRASADYISARAKTAFRKQGVDVTMHQLRHWLGCKTQELYRDARVTQELLGQRVAERDLDLHPCDAGAAAGGAGYASAPRRMMREVRTPRTASPALRLRRPVGTSGRSGSVFWWATTSTRGARSGSRDRLSATTTTSASPRCM